MGLKPSGSRLDIRQLLYSAARLAALEGDLVGYWGHVGYSRHILTFNIWFTRRQASNSKAEIHHQKS